MIFDGKSFIIVSTFLLKFPQSDLAVVIWNDQLSHIFRARNMRQLVPSFFGRLKDTGSPTFEKKHFHFNFMFFSKGNKVGMRSEVAIEFVYPLWKKIFKFEYYGVLFSSLIFFAHFRSFSYSPPIIYLINRYF